MFAGATIADVMEERGHSMFNEAIHNGEVTMEEAEEAVRVWASQEGHEGFNLDEEGLSDEEREVRVEEGVADMVKAKFFGNTKQLEALEKLPSGIRAFIARAKAWFMEVLRSASLLKKLESEGAFTEGWQRFLSDAVGLTEKHAVESGIAKQISEEGIVEGVSEVTTDAETGERLIDGVPESRMPFSLGRSRVQIDEAQAMQDTEKTFEDLSPEAQQNLLAVAEKQMQEVRAQYEGTDAWMKTPNGKPTNLSERQWLQVRTPLFKRYFGDWENDPANASKVLDLNGEPLVVYHGSPNEFTEFSSKKMGANGTDLGQGHYFTNNRDTALGYKRDGGSVYSVFLDIKKPLSDDSLTITKKQLRDVLLGIDKVQTFLSNYGDIESEGLRNVLKEAVELEYDGSDNDIDLIGGIVNASGDTDLTFEVLKKVTGFDGSTHRISESESHYVVGLSNQIKSATDNQGAFSESGDIRYSIGREREARAFRRDLENFKSGSLPTQATLSTGRVGFILHFLGFPDAPITITQRILKKAERHGIDINALDQLPEQINHPVMVFQSGYGDSRKVILTQLKSKNNQPVIVAVELNTTRQGIGEVVDIRSVHAKEHVNRLVDWAVNKGRLLYVDKKKAQAFLQDSAPSNWEQYAGKLEQVKAITKDDIVNPDSQINYSIARKVPPTDYPQSAHKVIATTNVRALTKALLKTGGSLVVLDPSSDKPMMVSPAYKRAKREGSKEDARDIILHFLTPKRLQQYADVLTGKKPVFVPIQQREGESMNMLPLALAQALVQSIGGRVSDDVHQIKKGGNTGASTQQRGNKAHDFVGSLVLNPGETVVLVDDTFTSGNTLAALYDYLNDQDVSSEHIFTLASGRYGKDMAASTERQQKVLDKLGIDAKAFNHATGLSINAYTGSELQGWLLNGKPEIQGFLDRFHEGGIPRSSRVVRDTRHEGQGLQEVNSSFSLGKQSFLERAQALVDARKIPPKVEYYERASKKLSDLKKRLLKRNAGKRSFLSDAETRKLKEEELYERKMAEHEQALHDLGMSEEMRDMRNLPITFALLENVGKLESKSSMRKRRGRANDSLYDDAPYLPGYMWGGNTSPDVAAHALYESGLLQEDSVSAMWSALDNEFSNAKEWKERYAKAKKVDTQARKEARAESREWSESDRAFLYEAIATLSSVVAAMPKEIRHVVGGASYTQMLETRGDKGRLTLLEKKMDALERALEKELSQQYDTKVRKLLEQSKPAKGKAGEKPKGRIGAEGHALFDVARKAIDWTGEQTDSELAMREGRLAGRSWKGIWDKRYKDKKTGATVFKNYYFRLRFSYLC